MTTKLSIWRSFVFSKCVHGMRGERHCTMFLWHEEFAARSNYMLSHAAEKQRYVWEVIYFLNKCQRPVTDIHISCLLALWSFVCTGQEANGAKPSAGTVWTAKLDINSKLIWLFCPGDIIDPLLPSNVIWRHRFGTLAQVMACCLTAPSHYLGECLIDIPVRFNRKCEWYANKRYHVKLNF